MTVAARPASQLRSLPLPAVRRSRKAMSSPPPQTLSRRRAHTRRPHLRPRISTSSSFPPITPAAPGLRRHTGDPSATFKSP
jgi:uncharacterized protein with von Willebrand factor type A (vWA) domain